MQSYKFKFGLLVLILAMLGCNLGAPASTSTPTHDATIQAELVLATGFAELTSSAPAPTTSDTPTETPSPTATALLPTLEIPSDTPIPSATNTSPPNLPDWPLVRQGDSGPVVAALQYLLKFKGQNISVDGDFGPITRNAVVSFQNASGLGADGIVGPQTWSKLIQGAQIKQGSNGDAVRAAQHLLRVKFNYNITVDGNFGPQTDTAVRNFQAAHGLSVDGIVGPDTWQALVAVQP